jgi:hypothetical protein
VVITTIKDKHQDQNESKKAVAMVVSVSVSPHCAAAVSPRRDAKLALTVQV